MTLIKSILLGSAAGIVAVAAAQAADLPTKKAAPAEYVKVCNVGGMAGFIIPGSDTCLKISGYITAQFEAGNIQKGYGAPYSGAAAVQGGVLGPVTDTSSRSAIGYSTRLNISFDARQDTAYGVLRGYFDMQVEAGSGFDNVNTLGYLNHAYVQWAGITAGKANSFFSFLGGGEAWANIFSPDRQGFNQPDLFAYTATFGGGFSASISFENPAAFSGGGGVLCGDQNLCGNYTYFGQEVPDIVGALRVDQGWGSAQISGIAHQVHVFDGAGNTENKWGFGILGGVTFKLPQFGPGDNLTIEGVYTENAIWYSGIPDGMWGEYGQVNGNGIAMPIGDTYSYINAAGNQTWATPTAWSVVATAEHHFGATFSLDPEVAYAELHWSGGGAGGNLATNSESWIGGLVAHWDPVPHLDFEMELLYQHTHQSTPGLYTAAANGGIAFPSNSDGVAGRFEITRDF
jgi:hypothetical protein